MFIYHIVFPERWEQTRQEAFYEADSLREEGFIHCSYEDQLEGVIQRYYSDADEIVVLSVDANRLTSPLVSEPSTNGEPYPHIYGPINLDAVVKVETRSARRVPQLA